MKRVRKCVVFGGGGFLGKSIVEKLIKEGIEVTVFDRSNINIKHNVKFIEGSFCNDEDIKNALIGQDVVINLISTTSPQQSMNDMYNPYEVDVVQTIKLLNYARENNINKIIFSSSGGTVYGIPKTTPIREEDSTDPINHYGISKLTIEKILRMYNKIYNMNNVILRISNPYGIGQNPNTNVGAVTVFLYNILEGREINIFGDGSIKRDYIHVNDVAEAFYRAILYTGGKEDTFNIGTGEGYSLMDIIKKLEKVTNKTANIKFLPNRKIDVPVNILDIQKSKEILNFNPSMSFEKGLENYYTELIDNYHKI